MARAPFPELDCDVVIAGAGPAGSTTALRLARAGFDVVVVEPKTFPRFKACGEFMSPECLSLLSGLGLAGDVAALGAHAVRGMILHAGHARAHGRFRDVGRACAPFDHGWAVRRDRFDDVLLSAAKHAGVRVFTGHRAQALLRTGDGSIAGLRTRHSNGEPLDVRARFTIGADGLRSRVARELGVQRAVPWLDKIALTTRYAGVPWSGAAEVHFFEGGYFACTAVDSGLVSLNLVVDRSLYARAECPRDEFLERAFVHAESLGDRLRQGRRVDPVRGLGPLAGRTTAQTFAGEYRNGKKMHPYTEPGFKYKDNDIDGEFLSELTKDLVEDPKSRDGIPHSLFPLRSKDLSHYRFTSKGETTLKGRRTIVIDFTPVPSEGVCVHIGEGDGGCESKPWKGTVWVDAEDLQPARIQSELAYKIPWGVRVGLAARGAGQKQHHAFPLTRKGAQAHVSRLGGAGTTGYPDSRPWAARPSPVRHRHCGAAHWRNWTASAA